MSIRLLPVLALLLATTADAQETGDAKADGLKLWSTIYEIVSHPRCANCHVGKDNRPRWSGPSYGLAKGEWKFHGMNVNAGASRIGVETIPCSTCHQATNSAVPHGPPGSQVWALAPVEMEWWQKSSAEICAQIKDPARNGGRSLDQIADHIDNDELVHWGWDPGPGRKPAPFSRKEAVAVLQAWAAAGAPCPAGDAAGGPAVERSREDSR